MTREPGKPCRSRRDRDAEEIPRPPETWPIIEHEPERLPVVPPDWEPPVPDRMAIGEIDAKETR